MNEMNIYTGKKGGIICKKIWKVLLLLMVVGIMILEVYKTCKILHRDIKKSSRTNILSSTARNIYIILILILSMGNYYCMIHYDELSNYWGFGCIILLYMVYEPKKLDTNCGFNGRDFLKGVAVAVCSIGVACVVIYTLATAATITVLLGCASGLIIAAFATLAAYGLAYAMKAIRSIHRKKNEEGGI